MDESTDSTEQEDGREMHYFDLKTINVATNGFSDGNKLGQGGFGPVYKVKARFRLFSYGVAFLLLKSLYHMYPGKASQWEGNSI